MIPSLTSVGSLIGGWGSQSFISSRTSMNSPAVLGVLPQFTPPSATKEAELYLVPVSDQHSLPVYDSKSLMAISLMKSIKAVRPWLLVEGT